MWGRKDIKRNARRSVKKHYWVMIFTCVVLAYFMNMYAGNGTLSLIQSYNEKQEQVAVENSHKSGINNTEMIERLFGGVNNNLISTQATKGALASIINNIGDAGSVIFGILNIVNQFVFHGNVMSGIIIALGVLIGLFVSIFIGNPIRVSENRLFLEASNYKKVSPSRLLFVFQARKAYNVGIIMFLRDVKLALWSITIVGGLIKKYSYMMVPFILAENPAVTKKQAFALSIEMMKGNKWNAFKLAVSLIGWKVLSWLTGGLLAIFYVNPYITATKTELYYKVRQEAIDKKIEHYECFNDRYLTAKLADDVLSYPISELNISGKQRMHEFKHDYRRTYSIRSIILLFFTFSIIGWLWEVSLHLSSDGFVNRGVQHGPWLPVYGAGGVAVLLMLKKLRDKPLLTFVGTVVLCGILEYFTSYCLEVIHNGTKWWDYSGYFLNINGRVCAEGLLVFGLGGTAFIYYAAPFFDDLYKKIPIKTQIVLCVVSLTIFGIDVVYSQKHPNMGKGITDYKSESNGTGIKGQECQIENTV